MNRRQIFFRAVSANQSNFLVIFSICAVLIATLYPFNFSFNNVYLQQVIGNFHNTSFFQDQVNNILLFMPLGFSFTSLLQKTRMTLLGKLLTVILLSAGLSLTVEVLQVFLPSRQPTPADIFNNTIGGFAGLFCFYFWNSQSFISTLTRIENSRDSNVKKIISFFIGYILLIFLIAIPWQSATHLSNWDLSFPLLLGNEKIGDRPWEGYVSQVDIADKAISRNEVAKLFTDASYFKNIGNSLLASYQFNGKCCYQDRTGKLPQLLWRGLPSDIKDEKGVFLNSSHWLETAAPVTSLSQRIGKTSEFTVSTTVATAKTEQTGPARIISVSPDFLRRNFTIGQEGNNLDLRLRTSITGENGSELRLNVPGIFADTKPHHIVITYSKANLQVYVDKLPNSYSFNLLELFPQHQIIFYYAVTFIPLGFGLALITLLAKKVTFNKLLLLSGMLLPALILEGILVSQNDKNISLKNILLGILFTSGTALIFRLRAAMVVKSRVRRRVDS